MVNKKQDKLLSNVKVNVPKESKKKNINVKDTKIKILLIILFTENPQY